METDAYCKRLAWLRPDDLLVLTGDQGARVVSKDILELRDIQRRVDFVLQLQRGDEVYYRHLEFQAQPDTELIDRCFLYNTQMTLQYKLPVVTTILYLFEGCEVAGPVFRVMVHGRVVNEWWFDRVLVWELEAETALAQELPGLAALVPLMKEVRWEHVERAVRQVETKAPAEQQADLLAILRAFGESKYTVEQLNQLIGRERLMESSIYKWGLEEGHAKGLAEGVMAGQLTNAREVCRGAVRKWHPQAGAEVWRAIEDCTDIAALNEVTVNANEWGPDDILRRLTAVVRANG